MGARLPSLPPKQFCASEKTAKLTCTHAIPECRSMTSSRRQDGSFALARIQARRQSLRQRSSKQSANTIRKGSGPRESPFTKEPFPSTDRMRGVHSLLFLADEADAGHHSYSISHRIKSLTSTPAELVSRLRPRLVSQCRQRICSPTLSIALTMCTKRGSCPTSQVFAGTRPTVRRRNRRPSRIVRTPAAALELQTVTRCGMDCEDGTR